MPRKHYKIYGFEEARLEVSDGEATPAIVTTLLDYPNKITPDFDTNTIAFEGGDEIHQIEKLRGVRLTIEADCLPVGTDIAVFDKTPVTTGLPSGEASRVIYLTKADVAGVAVGFRGRAPAEIYSDGALQKIGYVQLYIPVGTWTILRPGIGFATSGKPETTQYRLTATRAMKNIIGTALPGVATEADAGFFHIIEES